MSIKVRISVFPEFNNFLTKDRQNMVYKQKARCYLPDDQRGDNVDLFLVSLPVNADHPKGFAKGDYMTTLKADTDNFGNLIYVVSTQDMQMLKQAA